MQEHQAIKTNQYLEVSEIEAILEGVEYIIMAAPSPDHFKNTPVHVTIFLNTQEHFSQDIKEMIFDKFCQDYKITASAEVMSQLMPVGFATTSLGSAMPMLLVKIQDQNAIPHIPLHVIDFLAASDQFEEVVEKSLSGWTYVRE